MDDIKQLDLYALLGISSTAKTKEIKTAYRKKALTCHPDKNPDDPLAVKLFHQLNEALKLLTDEAARASYDKVLKAREANKARYDALNSQRKKLKTDLEELERRAFEKQAAEDHSQQRLDRLKKQTFAEMKAEAERVCQEKADRANEKMCSLRRIRIRWKADKNDTTNGGYSEETLKNIFSKYGRIEVIVVSGKKKGSALLEFSSVEAAKRAQMLEVGNKSNPLSVKVVGGDIDDYYANINVPTSKKSDPSPTPLFSQYSSAETRSNSNETSGNYDDFKAMVFQRMKEAQAQKKSDPQPTPLFPQYSSAEIRSNSNETSGNYDDFKDKIFQRMKEAQAKKESMKSDDSDFPLS